MGGGRMQQQSGFNSYNQVRLPALPDPLRLAPQAMCCSPILRRPGSELPRGGPIRTFCRSLGLIPWARSGRGLVR